MAERSAAGETVRHPKTTTADRAAPMRAAPGSPMPSTARIAILRLAFLAFLLVLWALIAALARPGTFAGPLEVFAALGQLAGSGRLWPALGSSLQVYLGGTLLAVACGAVLGVAMGLWQGFGRMIDIYVHALAATPRVAFIPLIIVVLGLGLGAKMLVVFLGAVMPVILNTYAGVRASDPEFLEMAEATGASRARILRHVILPGAAPYLIAGIRIGATIGLINTIVAELYTAIGGLGGLLANYGARFRMPEYLAVVLVLALIGVTVTEGLRLIEKRLLRWRDG